SVAGAPMNSDATVGGPSLPFASWMVPLPGRAVKSAVIAMYSDRVLTALRPYSAGLVAVGASVGLPLKVIASKASRGAPPPSPMSLKLLGSPPELAAMRTLIRLPRSPGLAAEMASAAEAALAADWTGDGGLVTVRPTIRTT